jgi:methionyl-tRNA formyltransferase
MRIVYFGSGQFGLPSLDALAASSHKITLVVTQPAQPAGRNRKPAPTAAAEWAARHNIPLIETADVNTPETVEKIASQQPDLILVIAFGQKIGKPLINLPPKGAINVHASLLPKYRGAAPVNWAIINGETETGISIIELAEKMDAGRICGQVKTEIKPDETAGELHDRLAKLAAPLLLETLRQIENGTAVYTEQDHSKATLAPKLKKSDGFVDFAEPADTLKRKLLGFWPWPGASVNYLSKETGKTVRVTFAMAEVLQAHNPAKLPPGTLENDLNVICGRDALKIIKIKPEGSRLMAFEDFVNGRHIQPGDAFEKIDA